MKLIEEYNIQQVKICGAIVNRLLEAGESIEKFAEFTRYIRTRARPREIRNFRLSFVVDDKNLSNDEFLASFGYSNLKALRKIKSILDKRGITDSEIADISSVLRKIDLKFTKYGRVKG